MSDPTPKADVFPIEILKARKKEYRFHSDLVTELALRWSLKQHNHSLKMVRQRCKWCAIEKSFLNSRKPHVVTRKTKPAWWKDLVSNWRMAKRNTYDEEVRRFLANIKKALPALKKLLAACSGHWGYEDPIYRLYHQSWKVYDIQQRTEEIVAALKGLAPASERRKFRFYLRRDQRTRQDPPALHPWFMEIVDEGLGKKWKQEDNHNWLQVTRPIVEAFLHTRYFLEMVVKYGKKFRSPPVMLDSGWAAVLYLYDLR